MTFILDESLTVVDSAFDAATGQELIQQQSMLEMIASENFGPASVTAARDSVLTNKYAEVMPGKRYYGDCVHMDLIEQLSGNRGKELFGVESANVQPHARAQANAAAMFALLEPGATILGLDPAHGGHLTYGMQINFSSNPYNVVPHHLSEKDMLKDRAEVETLALAHHRKLIAGGRSAYTRQLNFAEFRRIADLVGVYLIVNMGHFVDLVATGLHPNPVPDAGVVTATTYKSLNGQHGGVIRSKEYWHAQSTPPSSTADRSG